MLQDFISFIQKYALIPPEKSMLLAVSGGVDSVVMTHLFHEAGFQFAIAHANFHLRDAESDEDQEFVRQIALHLKVPFFTTSLNTKQLQSQPGISIQMAARKLRYEWFEQLRIEKHYDLIATGHHHDDLIETFFINLLRGTGLAGLHGIPIRQGNIIRPLLFATREEILGYAIKHKLAFREDSTNAQTHYLRNKIRHELLPIVERIQPQYRETIGHTVKLIADAELMIKSVIREKEKNLFHHKNGQVEIAIPSLMELNPTFPWLYALLSPFGFNEESIHDLINALEGTSGKQFFSNTHRLTKDRNKLIICSLSETNNQLSKATYLIGEPDETLEEPVRLKLETQKNSPGLDLTADSSIALIDKARLTFPLVLRKWKPGDCFYPFGMNRKKKLSDFFIDEKIPLPEKERIWLLCSNQKIVWIIGHRIDHRFRVTNQTREILQITLIRNHPAI